MADRTDNALRACMKALDEVIAPAIDPAHPLANEQLRLVRGFLAFFAARMDHVPRRERFELEHYRAMGARLLPLAQGVAADTAARLEDAVAQAGATLAGAEPSNDALRAATARLTAAVSSLVRCSARAEPALRDAIERQVFTHSRALVDLQRTWFALQGFDLHPEQLRSLDDALRVAPQA